MNIDRVAWVKTDHARLQEWTLRGFGCGFVRWRLCKNESFEKMIDGVEVG